MAPRKNCRSKQIGDVIVLSDDDDIDCATRPPQMLASHQRIEQHARPRITPYEKPKLNPEARPNSPISDQRYWDDQRYWTCDERDPNGIWNGRTMACVPNDEYPPRFDEDEPLNECNSIYDTRPNESMMHPSFHHGSPRYEGNDYYQEEHRERSPPRSPTPERFRESDEEKEYKNDIEELEQIMNKLRALAWKRTPVENEIHAIINSLGKIKCQWWSENSEIYKIKSAERDAYYDERVKQKELLEEKRLEEEERKRREAEDRINKKYDKMSREILDEQNRRDEKKRLEKVSRGNKKGQAVGDNVIETRRRSAVNRRDSDMEISDEEHDRLEPTVPPPYRFAPIISLTIPNRHRSHRPGKFAPDFEPSSSSCLDLGHERRRRSRSRSADERRQRHLRAPQGANRW